MELVPETVRQTLPKLGAQDGNPDPTVYLKLFTPDSSWTWWVTEGGAEENDFRFFGFVRGMEDEWGYFLLSELRAARGPFNLPIERDLHFKPGPFSKVVPARR